MNYINNDKIEKLCEDLKMAFSERIICLLYYGSNAYNREVKETSDFDFCLVLDKRKTNDLSKIRKIVQDFSKLELSLHYLDDLEDDGWDKFQSDNHGVFYLCHFASVRTIIGDNIFLKKIHFVQKSDIIDSLKRQIIEYFWRLDNAIFTLSDEELLKSDIFRKYSIRITQDLLVSRGDITFSEINTISFIDFFYKFVKDKSYIQNQTKIFLLAIINKQVNSIEELVELKEVLYDDFRRMFK